MLWLLNHSYSYSMWSWRAPGFVALSVTAFYFNKSRVLTSSCSSLFSTMSANPVDLFSLRKQALKTIKRYKLDDVIGWSYNKDISISIFSCYCLSDPKTNELSKDTLHWSISTKRKPSENLPKDLSPVQKYLEHVYKTNLSPSFDIYDFDEKFLRCLTEAIWEWEREEFDSLSFGHFESHRESITKRWETLPPELKEIVPYFVNVIKMSYYVLRSQVNRYNSRHPTSNIGYSLQEMYHGPNPFYGYVKSGIAVDDRGFDFFTIWGQFALHGHSDSHVSPHCEFEKIRNGHWTTAYKVTKIRDTSMPDRVEFTNDTLVYENVRNGWKEIRDIVFLRAIDELKQENVKK